MDNPYAGQQIYEPAWSAGHDYGSQNPSVGTLAPPDFSSWQLDQATLGYVEQIWQEGARAGQTEAGGGAGQEGATDGAPEGAGESAVDETQPVIVAEAAPPEAAEAPDVQVA
jgi:hypothetical protein